MIFKTLLTKLKDGNYFKHIRDSILNFLFLDDFKDNVVNIEIKAVYLEIIRSRNFQVMKLKNDFLFKKIYLNFLKNFQK